MIICLPNIKFIQTKFVIFPKIITLKCIQFSSSIILFDQNNQEQMTDMCF